MKKGSSPAWFALNGLTIHRLTLSQDGELKVEFDLAREQTTAQWHSQLRGVRSFDLYEEEKLRDAARSLFRTLRERVMEPDGERTQVDCDNCRSSDCCRNYNVLLREEDIARLARRWKRSAAWVRRRYTVRAVDWCGDFRRQLAIDRDDNGREKCVFLKRDERGRWRCSVYEHRPQICRDYDMKACGDFVPLEEVGALSG